MYWSHWKSHKKYLHFLKIHPHFKANCQISVPAMVSQSVAVSIEPTVVAIQPVAISMQSFIASQQNSTVIRSIQSATVSMHSVTAATQALPQTTYTDLPTTSVLLESLLQSNPSRADYQPCPQFSFHPKNPESAEMQCKNALVSLTAEEQFKVLSKCFSLLLHRSSMCSAPDNFLELAANGMTRPHKCNCSNVIYLMCQSLDTMRSDQSDTLTFASQKDANGLGRIHGKIFCCQTCQGGRLHH